ncbi:MAG: 16S rRNA (guanine(966)-N(2))-methyltransferase RsmD [Deltaproteobacteria bacterium]|jgi:16S rRNA (guanine966-N2)-methyltransferase|nr:16S rRNA (guanine(966)-N(2))-methyltransferase RsmD [Deltaproteobacteria bacterium]
MRIIGGRLGGRDLGAVPDGVRPTPDRVRESLFSSLGDVGGLRVLDLFAGTGALGLEAFSRGAATVVFVERSRRVARDLSRRLGALGLEDDDSIRLVAADARKAIGRMAKQGEPLFDLVLLDPPYAEGEREAVIDALFDTQILADRARVVVEGPKRHPLPPRPGVRVVDERSYGDTLVTWLEASSRA